MGRTTALSYAPATARGASMATSAMARPALSLTSLTVSQAAPSLARSEAACASKGCPADCVDAAVGTGAAGCAAGSGVRPGCVPMGAGTCAMWFALAPPSLARPPTCVTPGLAAEAAASPKLFLSFSSSSPPGVPPAKNPCAALACSCFTGVWVAARKESSASTPTALTVSAGRTYSPLDSRAGMESLVPVPFPTTKPRGFTVPPSARPCAFSRRCMADMPEYSLMALAGAALAAGSGAG